MLQFSPTTRTLLPLQITFIFGIWVGLLSILSGAHLRLMSKFTPAVARAALSDGVTSAALVPTMLRAFFADTEGLGSAPALRQILTGGEPLGGGLSQRITSAWPDAGIYDLYGLTETGSCDFCLRPEEQDRGLGSIGHSTAGVEFRIAGESAVRRGRTPDTDPIWHARLSGPGGIDSKRLLRTAISGPATLRVCALTGLWNWPGVQRTSSPAVGIRLFPWRLTNFFASHPDVAAALTTGVPDPLLGERIHLLIVPQPGARLDQPALLAWASGKIEKFKLPDVIHFAAELPAGRTGRPIGSRSGSKSRQIDKALVGFRGDGERAGSEPPARGRISACWS